MQSVQIVGFCNIHDQKIIQYSRLYLVQDIYIPSLSNKANIRLQWCVFEKLKAVWWTFD